MTPAARRRLLATAASIATILALGVGLWQVIGEGSDSDDDVSEVSAGNDAECVVVAQGQADVNVSCLGKETSADDVEGWDHLREEEPWKDGAAPASSGPWAYLVGGTGGEGLYVRDGFLKDDSRLPGDPTISDGTTIYARCVEANGWEAVGGLGGDWLRVAYPQPKDDSDTWVYAYWTVPLGHNGQIPAC